MNYVRNTAEMLVREILNAYNRRPNPHDLIECNVIAERHLRDTIKQAEEFTSRHTKQVAVQRIKGMYGGSQHG